MKMKAQVVRKGSISILRTALLAGLGYAVFSLMLTSKPAYAASRNCNEELGEAIQFCSLHGNTVRHFTCPYDVGLGPSWNVLCNNGAQDGELCSET